MIYLYVLFCFLAFLGGMLYFKNVYNPMCLYTAVWFVAVFFHESGLIVYYELSYFTWFVIFCSHLFFLLGCVIGSRVEVYGVGADELLSKYDLKRKIYVSCLITLAVSGFAIIYNLKTAVSIYGVDLFANLMEVYVDRVDGKVELESIPYLSSFLLIALPLVGMYVKKYGFSFLLVIAIALSCGNSLTSGGRAGIVFSLVLFYSGYKSVDFAENKSGNKLIMIASLFILLAMLVAVSEQRTAGSSMTYATEKFYFLFGDNLALYKGFAYVAGPVGVLNEYLKECNFVFGRNTLMTFFSVLNKLGLHDKIGNYQDFFLVPMRCNVGTWIRELVEDFTIAGMLVVVPLFGALNGLFYKRSLRCDDFIGKMVWSLLSVAVVLSFFDWRFRSPNMWIALVGGLIFAKFIESNSKKI